VIQHSTRWAVTLLCAVSSCLGQTVPRQAQPVLRGPRLSEVLAWLPADTETVVGVNGAIPVPVFDEAGSNDAPESSLTPKTLERTSQEFALSPFVFKNGGLTNFLKGKTIVMAVEGSRAFRPPKALGSMLYEGCEITVLKAGESVDGESFMKNAASSAKRIENFDGTMVAVFDERPEDDIWTTFVAFPRNNMVLVATHEGYLRAVLARMHGEIGPRALPATLSEWKYVNSSAPIWGVRHYQGKESDLDPTSPYHDEDAVMVLDSKAIGATFSIDPTSRVATVAYLTGSSNARQILQRRFEWEDPESNFKMTVRQRAPGVVEGSVSLLKSGAFYHLIFTLTAMLGHAIYL
jgi:hypothetical protein